MKETGYIADNKNGIASATFVKKRRQRLGHVRRPEGDGQQSLRHARSSQDGGAPQMELPLMLKTDHSQSLINARRAALLLVGYAVGDTYSLLLPPDPATRNAIADLIDQFARLDKKEQKQIQAGQKGATHGAKGGRPKKAKA